MIAFANSLDYSGGNTSFSGYPHPSASGFFSPREKLKPDNGGLREPNTIPTGNKLRRLNAVFETCLPNKLAIKSINVQEAIMAAQSLTINLSEIRTSGKLYNLNDLHIASGGKQKHRPSNFLRLNQSQEIIQELQNEQVSDVSLGDVIKVSHGGKNPGTWVCKELVYTYAMWVSPAFHVKVVRHFDGSHTRSERNSRLNQEALSLYLNVARNRFYELKNIISELGSVSRYQNELLQQLDDAKKNLFDPIHEAPCHLSVRPDQKSISSFMAMQDRIRAEG